MLVKLRLVHIAPHTRVYYAQYGKRSVEKAKQRTHNTVRNAVRILGIVEIYDDVVFVVVVSWRQKFQVDGTYYVSSRLSLVETQRL